MHFEGKQTINVPIQTVWAYVMDPDKVAACAPGFKSMEILGADHFKPTLAVGVGPIKATFTLDVRLQDLQPPTHAGLTARGAAVSPAGMITAAFTCRGVGARPGKAAIQAPKMKCATIIG